MDLFLGKKCIGWRITTSESVRSIGFASRSRPPALGKNCSHGTEQYHALVIIVWHYQVCTSMKTIALLFWLFSAFSERAYAWKGFVRLSLRQNFNGNAISSVLILLICCWMRYSPSTTNSSEFRDFFAYRDDSYLYFTFLFVCIQFDSCQNFHCQTKTNQTTKKSEQEAWAEDQEKELSLVNGKYQALFSSSSVSYRFVSIFAFT